MIKHAFIIFLFFIHLVVGAEETISLKGEIVAEGVYYKANFELLEDKGNRFEYILRLSFNQNDSFCDFNVKRITAPQQTRGMKGIIFANKSKKCELESLSKKASMFWSQIEMIDISYRFSYGMKIIGKSTLNSLNTTYKGRLKFD